MRAIGISTIWKGMKQERSSMPKKMFAPGKRHLVST